LALFILQDLEALKEKLSTLERVVGFDFRPLILTVGSCLEEPSQIFVVLQPSTVIPVDSLLDGLIFAFKFQALFKANKYDDSVTYIWNVLDKTVFKLNLFQKLSTKVSKIVTDLE
jgi:hypothetical protein